MIHTSRIISGAGRGARLGFPTINFEVPPEFPYPRGIYAGWVYSAAGRGAPGGGARHTAAFHYGPIPAFGETRDSLEAFVPEGTVPLGSAMGFELIAYLRPIAAFDAPEKLVAQIKKDVAETQRLLS